MKVSITTSSFGTYDKAPIQSLASTGCEVTLNPFHRKLTKEESVVMLRDCSGLLAGTEILDRKVFESAKNLKVISRVGVGVDNIDFDCAKEHGILVFNTPAVLTESVTELIIGLVLDCMRGISLMDREMKGGKWNKHMGRMLRGKTVGIIGLGKIGSRIAEIFKKTFHCRVIYFDTYINNSKYEKMPVDELLAVSDIISFNSSDTKVVLDSNNVGKLKKGVVIVNTSRANLIDEDVIIGALKDGTVSFAAFDVFNEEPYHGKLRDLDNVILTPHIGSYAKEARIEMERLAVENLMIGFKEAGLL